MGENERNVIYCEWINVNRAQSIQREMVRNQVRQNQKGQCVNNRECQLLTELRTTKGTWRYTRA